MRNKKNTNNTHGNVICPVIPKLIKYHFLNALRHNRLSGSIIKTITPLSRLDENIRQAVGYAPKQADLPLPVLQHTNTSFPQIKFSIQSR